MGKLRRVESGLEQITVVSSGSAITVGQNVHLTARAFKTSMTPSAGAWADYQITGAAVGASNHTVALRADATVWTWGHNGSFVLGDPALPTSAVRTVPALLAKTKAWDGYDDAAGSIRAATKKLAAQK